MQALMNAVEKADIIVIDEVGKIEVESEKFRDAVKEAFKTEKPMLLTLHKKSRNPLLAGHQTAGRCPHTGGHADKQKPFAL